VRALLPRAAQTFPLATLNVKHARAPNAPRRAIEATAVLFKIANRRQSTSQSRLISNRFPVLLWWNAKDDAPKGIRSCCNRASSFSLFPRVSFMFIRTCSLSDSPAPPGRNGTRVLAFSDSFAGLSSSPCKILRHW